MKILLPLLALTTLISLHPGKTAMGQTTKGQDASRPQSTKQQRPNRQSPLEREKAFVRAAPQIGETVPDLEILDANGDSVRLSSFRGKYVVLTFGCLT